jgi:hypothetical protein
MASEERFVYGSRSLGTLLPRVIRPAFRRRAPATAQLLADWDSIVGPAIAAVTTPRRFSAGALTIACAGPIAMELQYLSGELIGRINTHLGRPIVTSLRFVQTATTTQPVPLPPPLPPADTAAVEAAVATLPEGGLRTALASLGRALRVRPTLSTRSPGKQ